MQREHRRAYRREKHTGAEFIKFIRGELERLKKQVARIRVARIWIERKIKEVGDEQKAILKARLFKLIRSLQEIQKEIREFTNSSVSSQNN